MLYIYVICKDCPSGKKVVSTVAPGIGYSAAIKLSLPAWVSRKKIPGDPGRQALSWLSI